MRQGVAGYPVLDFTRGCAPVCESSNPNEPVWRHQTVPYEHKVSRVTAMSKTKRTGSSHPPGEASTALHPLAEARQQLERAEALRRARKLDQAEKICRTVLKRHPDYVAMLYTFGLVRADKGDYAGALPHLIHAAMLNPREWKTLTVLSGVYLRLGAREMAARTLEQADRRKPDNPDILATLGEIYRDNREYHAAAEAYRKALRLDPSLHEARLGLGSCCLHLGRLSEAADAFDSLLEHRPGAIDVLSSMSELPADLIDQDLLALLDQAAPGDTADRDQFERSLAFARASALHGAGRYDEAWVQLVDANRLMAAELRDANHSDNRINQAILESARKHPRVDRLPSSSPDGQPLSLFIIGPSRSGKTTLEQLAGTIDTVERGYENPIVENAVRHTFQTAGLPTRNWIVELPTSLDDLCRECYFEELAERAGSARVFTNTHPGHIASALRIAGVVSNVRFIFMKRDIDDLTLRIYMKKFRSGNAHAYDIAAIRAHIDWYFEMIDVVADKLPNASAIIHYEDMIAHPDAALKSIVELCGLEPPSTSLPVLGDDRGCSGPYRARIAAAIVG